MYSDVPRSGGKVTRQEVERKRREREGGDKYIYTKPLRKLNNALAVFFQFLNGSFASWFHCCSFVPGSAICRAFVTSPCFHYSFVSYLLGCDRPHSESIYLRPSLANDAGCAVQHGGKQNTQGSESNRRTHDVAALKDLLAAFAAIANFYGVFADALDTFLNPARLGGYACQHFGAGGGLPTNC